MDNSKNEKRAKVVCLFNSFISISGGDTRFIEIFKRIKNLDKVIITPLEGKRICGQNKIKANFVLTTKEIQTKKIALTYFIRTFRALLLKIKIAEKDVLYSTSVFLPDTLPAFFLKIRNRKAKWIICIFLIIPTPFRDYSRGLAQNNNLSMPTFRRFLFFLSQQFAILIGKRWADRILVLNKMDKEYLSRNRGLAETAISVVNGGVDYKHIQSIEAKTDKVYDGIFLGRFHPQKGIFDLIKIWRLVCDKKPTAKLCIVGTGPAKFIEEVQVLITKNNLSSNIEMVGLKLGDKKFSLLKSSKIFLCPSYYESFAIVIAEAMACGLPVIAYDLPIYEDIYGNNIVRVHLESIHQFADAITTYLNDDNLRKSFGLEGEKFIERYDWDEIAEKEYQLIIDNNE